MSRSSLTPAVRRALGALERRLFRVLISFGLGRAAWKACAVLFALFALDRVLDPPVAARLGLTAVALAFYLWHLRSDLLLPMRRRPAARDLAAWWERAEPGLGDLLATTVDLSERAGDPRAGSSDFRSEVARQAEEAMRRLQARAAVPSQRARRSLRHGLLAAAALILLASLQPETAWIFLRRLAGGDVPWPSGTRLVLLPLYAEGVAEALPLESDGPESFHTALARGSVATVRVAAEGVVPERIVVRGLGRGERALAAAGGGEFVLRLPPAETDLALSFRGGDDRDGKPALRIQVGDAPSVVGWMVRATSPDYAGRPPQEGDGFEWRVLRGTRLEVEFTLDRPVREARAQRLDGAEVAIREPETGVYRFEAIADRSDQIAIALTGVDGFVRRRAAVLKWEAEQDQSPVARILFPSARWITVPGAEVPVACLVEDDFGLARATLRDFAGAEQELVGPGALRWAQVLRLAVPPAPSAEAAAEGRLQAELRAEDAAVPVPQAGRATTPWIEVVPPDTFDQRQAERIVRVREQVGGLRDRLAAALAQHETLQGAFGRRIRRDLEALVVDVEFELLTRLWSGLDPETMAHARALEPALLTERPIAGTWVDALEAAGLTRPVERSGLLSELAAALLGARRGPAQDLEQALRSGTDPEPAARSLIADLDRILEILTVWEDYQSAVNLLRDLIQRQREIHLRTREASGR